MYYHAETNYPKKDVNDIKSIKQTLYTSALEESASVS